MTQCTRGSQNTTGGTWFSHSTMCVPGMTHVIRHGSKCLYRLSPLATPCNKFKPNFFTRGTWPLFSFRTVLYICKY